MCGNNEIGVFNDNFSAFNENILILEKEIMDGLI